MPETRSPRKRLQELLSLACDGQMSKADKQELQVLVASSDEKLLDEYFDFLAVDALLRDPSTHRRVAEMEDRAEPRPSPAGRFRPASRQPRPSDRDARPDRSPVDRQPRRGAFSRARRWNGWVGWSAAAAAALTVVLAWQAFSDAPHATIIGIEQATWVSPEAPDIGTPLSGEWLELESGVVHLQFADGVHASLHGPTRMRTSGGNQCRLQWGELAAYVPPEATGFVVESSQYRVTDLGTSFRMVVPAPDRGTTRSTLRVTEGRIEVAQLLDEQQVIVRTGQTATFGPDEPLRVDRASLPELVVEGGMELVATHPRSLGYRQYTHNRRLAVFLERQHVALHEDVPLDAAATGRYAAGEPADDVAAAGTVVDVYLVHYAPTSRRGQTRGVVRFPAPIIGVLYTSKRLNETNSTLGAGCTLRCRHPERGLEMAPNRNSDVFTISRDRRTLTVRCRAESIDQLRVLVESPVAL